MSNAAGVKGYWMRHGGDQQPFSMSIAKANGVITGMALNTKQRLVAPNAKQLQRQRPFHVALLRSVCGALRATLLRAVRLGSRVHDMTEHVTAGGKMGVQRASDKSNMKR